MVFYKMNFFENTNLKVFIGKNFIKVNLDDKMLLKRKTNSLNIFQNKDTFYLMSNSYTKKELILFHKRFKNLIELVKYGYNVRLRFVGIGYRLEYDKSENKLELRLGFSIPIIFNISENISVKQSQTNKNLYIFRSLYPNLVQSLVYKIRKLRYPEPYKGKGIRYQGEYVRRKEGKKSAN